MYKIIFLLLLNTIIFGTLQAQISYLDPSFGNGGIVRDTNNATYKTSCYDLLLLPDGRILSNILYYKYDPSSVTFWGDLIRMNSDGTPDSTFGNNGKITIQPTITSQHFPQFYLDSWSEENTTELLFDGKLSTFFSYKLSDTLNTVVSQWLPDGSPDLSFGNNGSVEIVDIDSMNYRPFFFTRKKMSNGQSVLIYYNGQVGTNRDIGFRFIAPNGQALLPNNAIQWNRTASYTETPVSAWILPDNKILIGCTNPQPGGFDNENLILQRFTSDGLPDPDFGYFGIASPSTLFKYFGPTKMVLLDDGRILVGQMNDAITVVMARFLPNGALDTTFGDQGYMNHSNLFGGLNYWGFSISNASPSGSFYIVGHKFVQPNFGDYEAAIIRMHPNGAIDTTFGSGTVVYLPKNELGFESTFSKTIVGSDGRILVSGDVNFSRFLFTRFLPEPGAVPWYKDADADGFGDAQQVLYAANQPVNYTSTTGDCADNNPFIYPGAPEICNGLDDNCDGKVDNIPVLAQCKSGIVVSLQQQGKIVLSPTAIWQPPIASSCDDNWIKFVLNPSDFDCSDIGTKSVTLTITDIWGTSSTCQTVIAVQDTLPPVLACKNKIELVLDANGNSTVLPAQLLHGSFDNCGISSIVLSQSSFTAVHVGTNLVQVTALDGSGNTVSCTTKVVIASPTSTEQIDLATLKFSITPNPATDQATVHIPSEYAGKKLWIQVTDVSGRVVFTHKIRNENLVSIDLEQWPATQYFISIFAGNNIVETLIFQKI
jgi:uncharacterized delta-60 repeat protein